MWLRPRELFQREAVCTSTDNAYPESIGFTNAFDSSIRIELFATLTPSDFRLAWPRHIHYSIFFMPPNGPLRDAMIYVIRTTVTGRQNQTFPKVIVNHPV